VKPTFENLISACALASVVAFGPPYTGTAMAVAGDSTSPQVQEHGGIACSEAAAHLLVLNAELKKRWGVEITALRRTAHGHMLDFRYRVLDPDKAKALFVRQTKPALIHEKTGKMLAVPETAKIGPLRNSNAPKQGKIYWMFFGNAGKLVKAGDKVTVAIGDFRAEGLTVE
jgi:hypothetical protein